MHNQSLLFSEEKQNIEIEDGELYFQPAWLDSATSQRFFLQLKDQVEWQQSIISVYGKKVKIPRLNAWYGDENCSYQYSGTALQPLPWLPCLLELKHRLEELNYKKFNSVLVNYYRDGNDSVSWHSDDEPELGKNPVVASISLGAERVFQLRHRHKKSLDIKKITLTNGSLLVMSGEMQHHWHHQIPKTKKDIDERINLTFRYVKPTV